VPPLADRREICLETRNWLGRRNVEVGTLMGGRNRKDSDRTIDALNAGTLLAAVGTSVADEGMDVKVISRGFGCTPVGSNVGRLTQQFGRFKRLNPPEKTDAVYYYFWDPRIGTIRRQLRKIVNAVKRPHRAFYSEEPGSREPFTRSLLNDLETRDWGERCKS
jgi:superfamily II DNA or RNA helicase